MLVLVCTLAGCFEWTEDSQGHLTSAGLPGVPLWQAKPGAADAQPITPAEMGFTPEEAAKMGGPVLVLPPDATSQTWRYRYYPADQNHCQEDLNQLLAARAQQVSTGTAPYCTISPTRPPTKGSGLIF